MALSGFFRTPVGNEWELRLEWSATQSVANNTSTITTKLYWVGLSQYATTYSTATKDGSSTIDGTTSTFSGSSLAKLSGAEKKLIKTHSKTVDHNSVGEKSVAISAWFDVELKLEGTQYNRVSVSGTAVLNDIPRASSLVDTTPSWTAGSSLAISVSRASSSFTHTAKVSVNGVAITTETGITTSRSIPFTLTENKAIFTQLNTGTSKTATVELITYNGTKEIGRKTYTGSVLAPARSTTTWSGNFDIGATITGSISRANSAFTHTVQLIFGGTTFTLHNKTTSTSWSYATSAIASSLYSLTPNSNTLTGVIRIYTYYDGVQVRTYAESAISCYVKNSNPTFTASQISYTDVNTTTKNITGLNNYHYIIQNNSDLSVSLSSLATANNSATIVGYDITVNGVTKTVTGIGSVLFGKINASTNLTLTARAKDSRGNFTEVTQTINMVEYSPVVMTASARRANNYENSTTISFSGSISLLPVGATPVNKNLLTATTGLQYRIKETTATDAGWGSWKNFNWTMNGAGFTATSVVENLDNTKSYNIEYRATDKIGSYVVAKILSAGQPILFIDSEKKSVGVGKFPINLGSFELKGNAFVEGSLNSTGDANINGRVNMSGLTAEKNTDGSMRVSNGNGYLDIAPKNGLHAHIYTDMPSIYFNKDLLVNGRGVATFEGSSKIIQVKGFSVTVVTGESQKFQDFSWDTAFPSVCTTAITQTRDTNSAAVYSSPYSLTRTGGRVYVSHIHNTSNVGYVITVNVLGIGY